MPLPIDVGKVVECGVEREAKLSLWAEFIPFPVGTATIKMKNM
jgi:hypothetical protein